MHLRFGLAIAVIAGGALGAAVLLPASARTTAEDKKLSEMKRSAARLRPTITAQPPMAPPLPVRKTAKAAPVPPVPDTWTEAELQEAKAQCATAMKGLDVDLTFEAPIKEGLCGNPAPIRLARLGKVTFTPAALVNCGLLRPLDSWIRNDVQPAAKRQLGATITTIEVMSDYSCRTAFGRVGRRLSQHAYVDALDIRGFVTATGKKVHVLESWGATKRDIVAAAKAKAKQDEAKQAAEQQTAELDKDAFRTTTTRAVDGEQTAGKVEKKSRAAANAARLGGPGGSPPPVKKAEVLPVDKTTEPAKLSPAAVGLPPVNADGRFLREAHAAACRIFGTTLGPEANEAHRNHFHVDMAQRRIRNICD